MRGCVWACGQAPGERRERRGLHSQGLGPHGPGCTLGADGPVPQALLPLALEGTDVGQTKAAQALAKLTITSNPEMTFPGERIYEVVRPLVSLLHLNCSGLQNFEALMALTNLAGISERLR